MKHFDVIIIGAGTAGMSARKEVAKRTDNYLVIDSGPLGTTCARVGCMPSKSLIQVANDYHQHQKLVSMKLLSGEKSQPDLKAVMSHVRSQRDRFTNGVIKGMDGWEDKLLIGNPKFINAHSLEVAGQKYSADKFVLATGSSPIVPKEWEGYKKFFIDTNSLFELETLPENILVVGLGAIGLEMGQALSRLGIKVTAATKGPSIGGLSDPELQAYVKKKLQDEFPIFDGELKFTGAMDGEKVSVELGGKIQKFDKVLLCVGRKPNLSNIGIENTGIKLNEKGAPEFSTTNLSIKDAPHFYIAGDVNSFRPLLHEAADEGKIAGHNAINEEHCYKRKVYLGITFSDPNIAVIGEKYKSLKESGEDFITGKVSFEGQGRAILKLKEQGQLHLYVNKKNGKILGAELQAPGGEHLAHLIAWVISMEMTVPEVLKLPFYHPVVEEGLRTALRDASKQMNEFHDELMNCDDSPIR